MDGSWALGWTALVAVATGILALVTAGLAWKTPDPASRTRDELVAQSRPALIPAPGDIGYNEDAGTLRVRVRNAGRGLAAFIRVNLDPLKASPANWDRAAMAAGDVTELTFEHLTRLPPAVQVLMDYRDLAGRLYASSLVITLLTVQYGVQQLTYYDVHLFRDVTLTPHGDAVPQPGLKLLPREHEG